MIVRAFAVLVLVTLVGGVVFNATTVALPKLFDERLPLLAGSPFGVGVLVAMRLSSIGAMAQLIVGRLVDRHPLTARRSCRWRCCRRPCLLLAAWAADWADAGARRSA